MDDDSLRRGRPTNHVVHGEGMAILAGDGLLTEAFALLARLPANTDLAPRKLQAIAVIATAAGAAGMVGGQAIDLQAVGAANTFDAPALKDMHARKTGALIRAAGVAGAIIGRRHAARGRRRRISTDGTSASPFRSSTTFSMSKGMRPSSARPPARTRGPRSPPIRRSMALTPRRGWQAASSRPPCRRSPTEGSSPAGSGRSPPGLFTERSEANKARPAAGPARPRPLARARAGHDAVGRRAGRRQAGRKSGDAHSPRMPASWSRSPITRTSAAGA